MINSTKKIFIADDDPDILEIIKLMLQTKGYEVDATSDPYKIFNYSDSLPDLILLDIWMSGIDGRDICIRLKEDATKKNIPIIFISANSAIIEIAKKYNADYISKPFEMDHLLNKIHSTFMKIAS